jgi:hypothetical protein
VYFCHADFERPSALAKRLEEQWYKQNLAADSNCTDRITLEDMYNAVGTISCDASTWQETLANFWKVFTLYELYLNYKERAARPSVEKVVIGLNVKAALLAIEEEFATMHFDMGEISEKSRIEVCVTGSLYIVGSALEAAHWEENSSESMVIV